MSAAIGLDALLEPLSRCLDAESARRVLDLRIEPLVQEPIDTLAERANEGTLTETDRSEYEALINAAEFISILKLKARQLLVSIASQQAPGSPAAVLRAMLEAPHPAASDVDEFDAVLAAARVPVRAGNIFPE